MNSSGWMDVRVASSIMCVREGDRERVIEVDVAPPLVESFSSFFYLNERVHDDVM